jgi:hypothetical protein
LATYGVVVRIVIDIVPERSWLRCKRVVMTHGSTVQYYATCGELLRKPRGEGRVDGKGRADDICLERECLHFVVRHHRQVDVG